jgi:hypothetical protein
MSISSLQVAPVIWLVPRDQNDGHAPTPLAGFFARISKYPYFWAKPTGVDGTVSAPHQQHQAGQLEQGFQPRRHIRFFSHRDPNVKFDHATAAGQPRPRLPAGAT